MSSSASSKAPLVLSSGTADGTLVYTFVESVKATYPFYVIRLLGGLLYLNLDASSSPKNPRIGIRWYNEFQYNWQLNGEQLQFGRLTSEIRAYLTPNLPFQITYAGRLGVTHNIGDYRFYQANTLGGTTNLREISLFPMNQRAEDLLMGAPSEVAPKQLRELHIRLNLPQN